MGAFSGLREWSRFKKNANWTAWGMVALNFVFTLLVWSFKNGGVLTLLLFCLPSLYMALAVSVLRNHISLGVVAASSVIICSWGFYWIPITQDGLALGAIVFAQVAACLLVTFAAFSLELIDRYRNRGAHD